jgi:hypothetical protein
MVTETVGDPEVLDQIGFLDVIKPELVVPFVDAVRLDLPGGVELSAGTAHPRLRDLHHDLHLHHEDEVRRLLGFRRPTSRAACSPWAVFAPGTRSRRPFAAPSARWSRWTGGMDLRSKMCASRL